MTRRKKQNGGYRYTANDRDVRRRGKCLLSLMLLAGWPTFGVVAVAKGWL